MKLTISLSGQCILELTAPAQPTPVQDRPGVSSQRAERATAHLGIGTEARKHVPLLSVPLENIGNVNALAAVGGPAALFPRIVAAPRGELFAQFALSGCQLVADTVGPVTALRESPRVALPMAPSDWEPIDYALNLDYLYGASGALAQATSTFVLPTGALTCSMPTSEEERQTEWQLSAHNGHSRTQPMADCLNLTHEDDRDSMMITVNTQGGAWLGRIHIQENDKRDPVFVSFASHCCLAPIPPVNSPTDADLGEFQRLLGSAANPSVRSIVYRMTPEKIRCAVGFVAR